MNKIKNIILARLFDMDASTVSRWLKRPIFRLIRSYFRELEIVEFLKNEKVERFEIYDKFDFNNYYQFYFNYFRKNPLDENLISLYINYLIFLKKNDVFNLKRSPFITSFFLFLNKNKIELEQKHLDVILKILNEFEDKNLFIPLKMALIGNLKIIYQGQKNSRVQNHHQLLNNSNV